VTGMAEGSPSSDRALSVAGATTKAIATQNLIASDRADMARPRLYGEVGGGAAISASISSSNALRLPAMNLR
jgi:hypothetical protein